MRAAAHGGAPAVDEARGSFTWKIEGWSAKAREKKLWSDVFVIGKKWCGVCGAVALRRQCGAQSGAPNAASNPLWRWAPSDARFPAGG